MTLTTDLYAPPDVEQAYHEWGANCGPTALAAILRKPVGDVRPLFFPAFDQRRYVNPTHMKRALEAVPVGYHLTNKSLSKPGRDCPRYGLCFMQFAGGWWDEKPAGVQYKFTHWLGVARQDGKCFIYDGNAAEWVHQFDWVLLWWPRFQRQNGAKSLYIRTAYEVSA